MRFSVIIPLYNKAPYVAKAIQSVLAQTFTDYELIIMDDGSSDDSFSITSETIEGHGHCHLYRQKNGGVSMARNNAAALSQGDYLCFLDADDWWAPDFLMGMSRLIEEFPDAGIYGANYTIVNETRHKTRVAEIGVEEGFERGYINYCQTYAKTMYMPLTSITVAIPRSIFDEMKGFPKGIKLGEDDYKQLVDNLRTYGLYPYYLSKEYHDAAKKELEKVDWKKQTERTRKQYSKSLLWSRLMFKIKKLLMPFKHAI